MGRGFSREELTIYQQYRKKSGLTIEKASANMNGIVSEDRLGRIEGGRQAPTPDDVVMMADCYKTPDLCNYYCSKECAIGKKYVPKIELKDLSNIILQTVASVNAIQPMMNRLMEIAMDGVVSDKEIPEFAQILTHLEQISLAADTMGLWIEKKSCDGELNLELLEQEKAKLQE